MQNKATRKKLNQIQIDKKINDDLRKRYTYFLPHINAIEFVPPIEHPLNRMFSLNVPLVKVNAQGKCSPEGDLGKLSVYYIPKKEHQQVINLLQKFLIPEKLHHDLIWAFLNMVFASCEAAHSTNFRAEFEHNQVEFFQSMDIFDDFAKEKKLLRGITFEYRDRQDGNDKSGRPNYGPLKSKKLKGHVSVQFVEKVLQNYQGIKDYSIFESMYENRKQYGKTDMFMGHKNAEKQSQSFYSSVIFDYLRHHLFNSAFDFLHDQEKYKAEVSRLKTMYPRNRLYLMIGKLMVLSGLLVVKEDHQDDDIIETIEKKLTPKLRANKKHLQSIEENNRHPKDGMIEITPFHELF